MTIDGRSMYARTMAILRGLEGNAESGDDPRKRIGRGGRTSAGIPPLLPVFPLSAPAGGDGGGGSAPSAYGSGSGSSRGSSFGGVLTNAAAMVARGEIVGPGVVRVRRPLEPGGGGSGNAGRTRGSFILPPDITPGGGGPGGGGGGFDAGTRTGYAPGAINVH